jgi:hypothetical protein
VRATLVVAVLLSFVAGARAQDCAEGRVRTDGVCCWPGQTFSTASRACEGTPACPSGLAAVGATCRASSSPMIAVSVPEGYGVVGPVTPVVVPAAGTTADWPAHAETTDVHRAIRHPGRDVALITVSLAIFDVGWALGIVAAMVHELHACAPISCAAWPVALIPLGGGFASSIMELGPGSAPDNTSSTWLGIFSALVQCVGIIASAVAVENRTSSFAYPSARPLVTASIVSDVAGAPAGVGLMARLP